MSNSIVIHKWETFQTVDGKEISIPSHLTWAFADADGTWFEVDLYPTHEGFGKDQWRFTFSKAARAVSDRTGAEGLSREKKSEIAEGVMERFMDGTRSAGGGATIAFLVKFARNAIFSALKGTDGEMKRSDLEKMLKSEGDVETWLADNASEGAFDRVKAESKKAEKAAKKSTNTIF